VLTKKNTHTHKWTLLKTVSPRYAIAAQVIVTDYTQDQLQHTVSE